MTARNEGEVTIDIHDRCLYNGKDKRGSMPCWLFCLLIVKCAGTAGGTWMHCRLAVENAEEQHEMLSEIGVFAGKSPAD